MASKATRVDNKETAVISPTRASKPARKVDRVAVPVWNRAKVANKVSKEARVASRVVPAWVTRAIKAAVAVTANRKTVRLDNLPRRTVEHRLAGAVYFFT